MHDQIKKLDELSRRRFVANAARTFLGVSVLGPALGSRSASAAVAPLARHRAAKNVIYFFMNGGMSHLDTFDPKPGAETQGPVEAIKTNADGVMLSQYLPNLANQMDKAALVRSLSSNSGAHERGQYYMRTSYNPLATIRHPGLGAWVANLSGATSGALPPNVVISGPSDHPGAGFMEARYAPIPIGNPYAGLQNSTLPEGVTPDQFNRRLALTGRLDALFQRRYAAYKQMTAYTDFYDDAVKLMSSGDLAAFDLRRESDPVRQAYGINNLGQGALLARRLVQAGVRFVEVNSGGWDTHENNFDRLPELAGVLDQAVAALLTDLQANGMLGETMVVIATEFGRTPNINDRNGRDHHPRVFSGMIAGGPIQGGVVHGKSDAQGQAAEEGQVSVPDFNATIAYGLGLPLEKRVVAKNGRPFTIADKGEPITSLF